MFRASMVLALVLAGCSNQLDWEIDRAAITPRASADTSTLSRIWAVTEGPCTPAPQHIEQSGNDTEPRDLDLGPGTHCFWSLAITRYERDTPTGPGERIPCRLEAIGTAERTLPAEQGTVVVTESKLDDTDEARDAWNIAVETIVPDCAPRRDPHTCVCPFSTADTTCAEPIDAGLVALGDTWACSASDADSALWCWTAASTMAGLPPQRLQAAGTSHEGFAPLQLAAYGGMLCALSNGGRVRCADTAPMLLTPSTPRVLTEPMQDRAATFVGGTQLAVGSGAGMGVFACVLTHTLSADQRRFLSQQVTCVDMTDGTPIGPVDVGLAAITRIAVGNGILCILREGDIFCSPIGQTLDHPRTHWFTQSDSDPTLATDLVMYDQHLCAEIGGADIHCAVMGTGTVALTANELSLNGIHPSVSSYGVSAGGADGTVARSWAGAPQTLGLINGVLGPDLACGVSLDRSARTALACQRLGSSTNSTSSLFDAATSLTSRDLGFGGATPTPVCPFAP